MRLEYPLKRSEQDIIKNTHDVALSGVWKEDSNLLIKGNNLNVLKTLLTKYNLSNKVNLVYIDPHFQQKQPLLLARNE